MADQQDLTNMAVAFDALSVFFGLLGVATTIYVMKRVAS